ncbi:hypothetical protein VNO78_21988 [Psophocarpus tetragonolobus]|uniref:F-box domain-containing protein n=1 Tax=Psophocarpus tetragonolobus TaxID=3891 RepID=A0AAN9SHC9_PSOTE
MEAETIVTKLEDLPEQCIAEILMRCTTTPVEVARLSLVSKVFYSATEYDFLWSRFFPPDLSSIVPISSFTSCTSKKALYFTLSDVPTIIDQGTKSFQLDKRTGKKCFMFSGEGLTVKWIGHPWINLTQSRFQGVARLCPMARFCICTCIDPLPLSPSTEYAAFLVFKCIDPSGIQYYSEMLSGFFGRIGNRPRNLPPSKRTKTSLRSDGWFETEIGTFHSGSGIEDDPVLLIVESMSQICEPGSFILHVEGIEVRPKHVSSLI